MDKTPAVLASDADRDRIAERLRHAVGDGTLDLVEFDERLRVAYAARTHAELARIAADLPAATVAAVAAAPVPSRWSGPLRAWLAVGLLLIGIWAFTSLAAGEALHFWPAYPIGFWGVSLLVSGGGGHCGSSSVRSRRRSIGRPMRADA